MSREAVAWLTRSPAARSARTNCAWVWIGSAVMTSRILRSRGRTDLLPHPLLRRRRRRDPLPQEPDLPRRLLHRRLHPSGSRAARDILGGHRTLRRDGGPEVLDRRCVETRQQRRPFLRFAIGQRLALPFGVADDLAGEGRRPAERCPAE